MKFRKKPIVIEAIQFNGENAYEVMDFAHRGCPPEFNSIVRLAPFEHQLVIRTMEGLMEAYKGDWIIKGIKGEFYPCKSDIFEATYEAVPE